MAVAAFVGAVKLRLAVENATNTSDDPTPIYVLDELVAQLGAGDAKSGVDAVVARLAHRNPVVKQKALKLVAHIGRRGSPDLRRLMARASGAVRDLLHYRCEPDPFKGDTVWKRVQEYAQEALEAVHGTGQEAGGPGPAAASSSLGGRIQGFGSDAAGGGAGGGGYGSSGGGYGGGASGGRMVGFGSADVVQSGMQALSSGMRSLSRQQGGFSQLDGDGGYAGGGPSRPPPAGSSQPIMQPLGAAAAPPAPSSAAPAAAGGTQHALEQRLVDKLCTPAGLRATPSGEDLRAFVEGLAPLDGPAVAHLLQRKLEAGPWQATLRALCAIEAVVESGASTACGQVAVHFQADPAPVRRAAGSPHASVRQRAQKLLGLLGDVQAGGGAQQQQQQQLITEDLLGEAPAAPAAGGAGADAAAALADLLGEPEPAAAAAAVAAGSVAGGIDLLAGLDVSAAAPAPPAQPAQPAAAAGPAEADLFGGMLLGGGAAAPPAAPPAAAPAPAAPQPSALDLLGGLPLGAGSVPGPAAPSLPQQQPQQGVGNGGLGDLLGGLSLGPAAPPAAAPPAFGYAGSAPQLHHALPGGRGLAQPGMQQPGLTPLPALQQQQQQPFGGMQPLSAAQPPAFAGLHQPHAQPVGFTGGLALHPPLSHGQASAAPNSAHSSTLSRLNSSGIVDSAKDNSFSFVGDALAAARRKS